MTRTRTGVHRGEHSGLSRVGNIGVEVDNIDNGDIMVVAQRMAVVTAADDTASGCGRLMDLVCLKRFGPISRNVRRTNGGRKLTNWRI